MDFLSLSAALHSCQNILSEKEQLTFVLAPGGATVPQKQVVQGGGQLPGVGGGRAAGKPG